MGLLPGNKLRTVTAQGSEDAIGYMHWCPGCQNPHVIYTNYHPASNPDHPNWDFNGNFEKPTFSPSILCYETINGGGRKTICHYFVRDGRIEYCGDSPHQFSGQTIELPDWPGSR